MASLKMFPNRIEKAILVGARPLHQSFQPPINMNDYVLEISKLVAEDTILNNYISDFESMTYRVMDKLDKEPVKVKIQYPMNFNKIDISVGSFGLGLILRFNMEYHSDLQHIPKLIYDLDNGINSNLQELVQKSLMYIFAIPGALINQNLASGVNQDRLNLITQQASYSLFGNVINFPFWGSKDVWPNYPTNINSARPFASSVPTLFITGTLDGRAPVSQVENIRKRFDNSVHIRVQNAGHVQSMWSSETFSKIIPAFLMGVIIESGEISYVPVKFRNVD